MRAPYLLDTCAALWLVADVMIAPAEAELLKAYDAGLHTYVSPITAWEVGNLARKGRFASSLSPQRWFERLMSLHSAALATLSPEVLIASTELPNFPANDPVDRIIAATAREYGFTVVTRDAALLDYGKQGYLNVLEC
ncbi:MAG: type II toxin-antitoxin system VapC family toxin [Proteobacteria bacterium]|nr:type II toxin-antitoxin system VapC family toxin [Pseudomonadota bacterium]